MAGVTLENWREFVNVEDEVRKINEAVRVIKDFRDNPLNYVENVEELGIGWDSIINTISDIIYSEFCRDYRDDLIEGAEVLKSGMYSDRIKEITRFHGVSKSFRKL